MTDITESQRSAIERLTKAMQEEYDVLYASRAQLEKDVARKRQQLADVSDLIIVEERKLVAVQEKVSREIQSVLESQNSIVRDAQAQAAAAVARCNQDVKCAEERKEKALVREAEAVSVANEAEAKAKSLESRLAAAVRVKNELIRAVEALR